MSDVQDTLTRIIQETCEPFPPADHIVKRLLDELPKHGLAIVGMGAKRPKPAPPSPCWRCGTREGVTKQGGEGGYVWACHDCGHPAD